MKIAKAFKLKNHPAGQAAELKELLTSQKFDYDNRGVLTRLRAGIAEYIKVKAAVAAGNAEIWALSLR